MARDSGFGALGKNFIIVGNAQHRIFGLRFGYLIRATTSFFCTLTPVPRVVKEGPRFHFLAPATKVAGCEKHIRSNQERRIIPQDYFVVATVASIGDAAVIQRKRITVNLPTLTSRHPVARRHRGKLNAAAIEEPIAADAPPTRGTPQPPSS